VKSIDMLLREATSCLDPMCKLTIYLTDPRYSEPVYRTVGKTHVVCKGDQVVAY
jgi:hypothetical protein